MSSTTTAVLDTVAKYQAAFDSYNEGSWSGLSLTKPVTLPTGQPLWVCGRGWAGGIIAGGVRHPASVSYIFTSLVLENKSSIKALYPVYLDASHAYAIPGEVVPPYAKTTRVDPLDALCTSDTLYVTGRFSTTDVTSWRLAPSQIWMFAIDAQTINTGRTDVKRAYPLPVLPGGGNPIYFGSNILQNTSEYFTSLGTQIIGGAPNLYLGRCIWPEIDNPKQWEYLCFRGSDLVWSKDPTGIALVGAGVVDQVSFWQEGKRYYLMAQQGTAVPGGDRDINLYTSDRPFGYRFVKKVGTASVGSGIGEASFRVPHARLANGKQLGYSTRSTTDDVYTKANPSFARPRFFEFTVD